MRLIDADELKELLKEYQAECLKNPSEIMGAVYGGLGAILDVIDQQPTSEPVKRGEWLRMERCNMDGDITYSANCSVCGVEVCLWQHESYCPNCGSNMNGDKE